MAQRTLSSRLWYEFLRHQLLFVWAVGYSIRYTGRENIPSDGGVLVVSNHQSHFDPPLVGAGCPRRMNYLARDTLFRFSPFRWLIDSLDAIPIDREGLGLSGIKETLRRLKQEEMVLIFPEGTRTRDGQVGSFRPGFGALARRSGAAVLPAAIEGAFDAWPRHRTLPRLGTIHVHYGVPILPEQVRQYDERALVEELACRIRQDHARLQQRPAFTRRRPARPVV